MSNQHIWRIENRDGYGPYMGGSEDDWADERHCDDNGRPTPICDRGIERYPDAGEICGFLSIHHVKKWFTKKELLNLYACGFHLKRVPIAEITAIGEKQVLAVRRN